MSAGCSRVQELWRRFTGWARLVGCTTADSSRAVAWYRRLGFEQVFEHRFEPHLPACVGIRRDHARIHLSEHAGDANPHGLVYVWVDDLDAIAAEFGIAVDVQPWAREVSLADPDGNRLRVAEAPG